MGICMNKQITESKEKEFVKVEEPIIIPNKKHLGYDLIHTDMYKNISSEHSNNTSLPYDSRLALSNRTLLTENPNLLERGNLIEVIKPSKHNPILTHLKMRSKRNSLSELRN